MSDPQSDRNARRAKVIEIIKHMFVYGGEPKPEHLSEYAFSRLRFIGSIEWDRYSEWGDLIKPEGLLESALIGEPSSIGLVEPLWKKTESGSIWRIEAEPGYGNCLLFEQDQYLPDNEAGKLHAVFGVRDRSALNDWYNDQATAIKMFDQKSGPDASMNESDGDGYWDRYGEESEKEEPEHASGSETAKALAGGENDDDNDDDAFYSRYDKKINESQIDPQVQFKQELEDQIREAGHKARILGYDPDQFKVLVMDSLYKVMGTN